MKNSNGTRMRQKVTVFFKASLALALVLFCAPALPAVAVGEGLAASMSLSQTAQQLQKGWWGTPTNTGAYERVIVNNGSSEPVFLTPEYDESAVQGIVFSSPDVSLDEHPAEREQIEAARSRAAEQARDRMESRTDYQELMHARDREEAFEAIQGAWFHATTHEKQVVNEALALTIAAQEGVARGAVELLDAGSLDLTTGLRVLSEIRSTKVEVASSSILPQWSVASFDLDASKTSVSGAPGVFAEGGALALSEGVVQVSVPFAASLACNQAAFECLIRGQIAYDFLGYGCDSLVFLGVRYAVGNQVKSMARVSMSVPSQVENLFSSTDVQRRTISFSESEELSIPMSLAVSKAGSYEYQMRVEPLFSGGELGVSVSDQPYRLEADQKEVVLRLANESVLSQANDALSAVGVEAIPRDAWLFDDVTFVEPYTFEPDQGAMCSLRLHRNPHADEAYGLMPICDEESVAIQPVRECAWEDAELQLQGVSGEGSHEVCIDPRSWRSVWTKQDPIASLGGSQLCFSPDAIPTRADQFAENEVLICGDGDCCTSVWVRDAASHEIWRINEIRYRKDETIPTLVSASVSSKGPGVRGAEYFGRDVVDVSLVVDDYEGPEIWGMAAASGVSEVSVSYEDALTKKTISIDDVKKRGGLYCFSISGDADVAVSDISIRVVDRAGNVLIAKGSDAAGVDQQIARLVADAHAPRISAEWIGPDLVAERYCPGGRSLRVTIEEELFSYTKKYLNDQVIFTISQNDGAMVDVHPADFRQRDANTWEYTASFVHDAEYRVSSMIVHDIVGRSARAEGQRFVVDTKAPAVTVSFDRDDARNGRYYAQARTATISIHERNFSPDGIRIQPNTKVDRAEKAGQPVVSRWQSDGDDHVATVLFPGEGEYELIVSGADFAANAMRSYKSESFVIDTVRPKISIDGLKSMAYTDVMDAVTVQMDDANLDAKSSRASVSKVTYNGLGEEHNPFADALSRKDNSKVSTIRFAAPAQLRANDGVYALSAYAVDLAGNKSEEHLAWSINRFGSTYLVMSGKEMLGTYSKTARDLHVLEVNPSGIDMEKSSVEVIQDLTARTLRRGVDYRVVHVKDAAWPSYRYEISREVFAADAEYQVILHSQTSKTSQLNENADKRSKRLLEQVENRFRLAGSDAEISFAIDATRPLTRFANVQNGQFENAASFEVEVEIKDNMALGGATMSIDGQDFELSAKELLDSSTHRFEVRGKNAPQQLAVTAWDLAGNRSEPQICTITVTDDVLYRITHNAPLIAGALGLLLCAALGAVLVMLRGRRR